MTFNVNLPLSTDKIRNFPGNVTTNNWPRLKANIAADHVFQDTAGGAPDQTGWHTLMHMKDQVADPAAPTSPLAYLYNIAGNIFARHPTTAAQADIWQLTGNSAWNTGGNGQAFFQIGKILVQSGTSNFNLNSSTTKTVGMGISVAVIVGAWCTFLDTNHSKVITVTGTNPGLGQFTVERDSGSSSDNQNFCWVCIGVRP